VLCLVHYTCRNASDGGHTHILIPSVITNILDTVHVWTHLVLVPMVCVFETCDVVHVWNTKLCMRAPVQCVRMCVCVLVDQSPSSGPGNIPLVGSEANGSTFGPDGMVETRGFLGSQALELHSNSRVYLWPIKRSFTCLAYGCWSQNKFQVHFSRGIYGRGSISPPRRLTLCTQDQTNSFLWLCNFINGLVQAKIFLYAVHCIVNIIF